MSETARETKRSETFCQYCGGKLRMGFFYTCHLCGSAYCYIHMSRHTRAHTPQGLGRQPTEIYAS